MRKIYAYLIKTRHISKDVVNEMVHRKMLYQDTYGNCVFLGYDVENPEKVIFGCKEEQILIRSLPEIYPDVITLKDFTLTINRKH